MDSIDLVAAGARDRDFADLLGVTKWVPEVPVHLAGEMTPAPDLIP